MGLRATGAEQETWNVSAVYEICYQNVFDAFANDHTYFRCICTLSLFFGRYITIADFHPF
ncbi:hypothetical protein HY30_06380 [Hyphomonas chukchiensis]|uniref:Uncharacterized protein n=1 Tax=Hyphomonas chukchiensis TaxID=1280947 RepID=A0A062UKV8_9PROT|nr:hypothetical protein HY30_06380 [Hyphomonas chukchiensis]